MAVRTASTRHVSVSRDRPDATRGLAIAVVAALVLVVAGVAALGLMLRARAATSATAGGLTLRVTSARWVEHDHGQSDGFQMPASMMPGAPKAGEERLAVEISVENPGAGPRPFDAGEFRLESRDGQSWPLKADNLSSEHIAPGLGVSGTVTFDLPQARSTQRDPGLVLVWDRAGKVAKLPLQLGAANHGGHT